MPRVRVHQDALARHDVESTPTMAPSRPDADCRNFGSLEDHPMVLRVTLWCAPGMETQLNRKILNE